MCADQFCLLSYYIKYECSSIFYFSMSSSISFLSSASKSSFEIQRAIFFIFCKQSFSLLVFLFSNVSIYFCETRPLDISNSFTLFLKFSLSLNDSTSFCLKVVSYILSSGKNSNSEIIFSASLSISSEYSFLREW